MNCPKCGSKLFVHGYWRCCAGCDYVSKWEPQKMTEEKEQKIRSDNMPWVLHKIEGEWGVELDRGEYCPIITDMLMLDRKSGALLNFDLILDAYATDLATLKAKNDVLVKERNHLKQTLEKIHSETIAIGETTSTGGHTYEGCDTEKIVYSIEYIACHFLAREGDGMGWEEEHD